MKIVKSLLFSSAAGLVAVAAAQAADLPVKAKPVEYVKVCSLYGAGFWYVPGTDTCLKIGAFVRADIGYNQTGTDTAGFNTGGGLFTRTDTSQLGDRRRSSLSVDLRTQTEYGTLRSYFEGGFENTGGLTGAPANDVVWYDRGFIQFAGVTEGRIRSFFDIVSPYAFGYWTPAVSGDSNTLRGIWGIAYTAQFGNGVSASISLEDGGSSSQGNNVGNARSRGHRDANLSAGAFGLGALTFDNEGWKVPDVVVDLRIDQAWGFAAVSAALHDASAGYYTAGPGGCAAGAPCTTNGHPDDKYGFAVSVGVQFNDVLGWKGDTFGVQATYSQGATGYVVNGANQSSAYLVYGSGNSAGFGWITDGTFVTGSSVELTTAWGIHGGFNHIWNPKWQTGIHGGYAEIDYDGTATANICAAGTPAFVGITAISNCSPNFSTWEVGSRTQWNPVPDLQIGIDVTWSHLNTALNGTATLAANGARPAGVYTIQDQDVLAGVFRIQRNFLP
jgi:hypothetical protein